MPLYPFATAGEVGQWQQSYRSGGHEPWHLDAGQTALSFAGWLGFAHVDSVVIRRTDATGAHVTVGFRIPGGSGAQTVSAAVVHLVRWGRGSGAPWEVVGTDDTTFSLMSPHYGTTVSSPTVAGGLMSGVDENIRVEVRALGANGPVGVACCVPAGGDNTPWHETVPFSVAPHAVMTVSASTGGHVASVERFTVTGLRASSSSKAADVSCDGSGMLAVVRAALFLPAPDTTTSVDVRQCGGGYARVFSVPSNLTCGHPGGSCYNDEQVFLVAVSGTWTVLDNGSGINCTDPGSAPAVDLPACRALGLTS